MAALVSVSPEQIEAGAKAIWRRFARVFDDGQAAHRWARMSEAAKDKWREEARACVEAMMESEHGPY